MITYAFKNVKSAALSNDKKLFLSSTKPLTFIYFIFGSIQDDILLY
jgi:hypothetical protein